MEQFRTIKYRNDEKEIDIYLQNDDNSIWLSRKDIAVLFDLSLNSVNSLIRTNLNYVANEGSTLVDFDTVRTEGSRKVTRKIRLFHQSIIENIAFRKHLKNFEKIKAFINHYLKKANQLLLENENIIIYDNGTAKVSFNVSYEEQTVWATQKEIAEAFLTTVSNINQHIKNILDEGELEADSVIKSRLNTGPDGKKYWVTVYNLDMALAVGFRVSTKKATRFRRWAAGILSQHMIKGYSINEPRCLECQSAIIGLQNRVLELENNQNKGISFYPGDELKSFAAIEHLLKRAKEEIIIVDNYFGHDFDSVLKEANVEKTIITNPKNTKIESNENYKVVKSNDFHDRYIVVDDMCYFFGQSFGELGSKISYSIRIQDKVFIDTIKSFKQR